MTINVHNSYKAGRDGLPSVYDGFPELVMRAKLAQMCRLFLAPPLSAVMSQLELNRSWISLGTLNANGRVMLSQPGKEQALTLCGRRVYSTQ